MLCSFLAILLMTMDIIGMEATPYATLSPFFHIPLDPGGLTILVCVVNDVLNRDDGMSWLSRSTSRLRPVIYNVLGEEDSTENAVSVHSLVSTEWETYTCFVSHKSTIRFMHRDYGGFQKRRTDLDDEELEDMCSEHQSDFTKDIRFHTDLLIIQALRIILLKITIFNILITTHAVIKW
ncbi:hypothetical protein MHYP_G00255510 [Metynnis hypsauchen]